MPYVERGEREKLADYINALAVDIVSQLSKGHGEDISRLYRAALVEMADALIGAESGAKIPDSTPAQRLASQVYDVARSYGYKSAWLVDFNYSITRLIQIVPRQMVQNGSWKSEFRYWLYAMTVGAIEQSALDIRAKRVPSGAEWAIDGLFGVLVDIKDEYKRRDNTAYETMQIKKSGDAYDCPFRTELLEIRDKMGFIDGYQEVMKDFGARTAEQEKGE